MLNRKIVVSQASQFVYADEIKLANQGERETQLVERFFTALPKSTSWSENEAKNI